MLNDAVGFKHIYLATTKDFATYPIDSFLTNNDEGDIDLDLAEISYVASRHEG